MLIGLNRLFPSSKTGDGISLSGILIDLSLPILTPLTFLLVTVLSFLSSSHKS